MEKKVNILLFCTEQKGTGDSIQRIIESMVSEGEIEIFMTLEGLNKRLRQPGRNVSVMVLEASDRKELCDLISIQDLFYDIPIILILPDSSRDTVALGHKLYPRFISYADSEFSDVSLVIRKMIKRPHPKLRMAV